MLNYVVFKIVSLYLYFVFLLLLVFSDEVKHIQSVQVIGGLHNGVHIRNESDLVNKLNKFINDGYNNLQIVTDFDNTLTVDSGVEGKYVLNTFEMLRKCPSVPQNYKNEEYKLYLKYKPIETDPNLSVEEKSRHMVEWYKEAEILMKGMKFPREELQAIANNVSKSFRDGVPELILMTETHKIPIIVLSSGLGDALTATMDAANLSSSCLKVISNFLDLNNEDVIMGMKGEPIHSLNKNEASIKNTDFYEHVQNRKNVLLVGDTLGDANMADGLENVDSVIKVGFLSKKRINQLSMYLNEFDIVLEDDQTMSVVNGILKLLN